MKKRTMRSLAAMLTIVMVLSLLTPALAARPILGEASVQVETPAGDSSSRAHTHAAAEIPAVEDESAAELFAASKKSAGGDQESAYMEWYPATTGITYTVKYRSNGGSWVTLTDDDTNLIREYNGYMRVDIPGLKGGTCEIQAVPSDGGTTISSGTLTVQAHDRSGFAFIQRSGNLSTGIGAYKDDGTLKSGAVVLYVTEANKDKVSMTVTTSSKGATTFCEGIQNIFAAYQKGYETRPLDVRFIGRITDPAVLDKGDLMLKGNGSAAEKRLACGVTLEGIGPDTTFDGFGLRILNASGVEVRNIGFMNCNSGEGDDIGLQQYNDHVWVHNCDLFYGDAGSDADQVKGDGALDTKQSTYITHSYNHFWDNGKCNLQGMKTETEENYITYHHNWYDHSDSRHPRIRTCSVHIYNNYYDGNAKYGVGVTMGASAFVDSNYFRNCKYPMLISMQGNDSGTFSSENGGVIKSYGNKMTGQKGYTTYAQNNTSFDAYEVTSRTATVPSTVKAKQGGTTYNNFDTKLCTGSYFQIQPQSADAVAAQVTKWAGRVQGGDFQWEFTSADDEKYAVNQPLKNALSSYKGSGIIGYGGKVTQNVSGGSNACTHTNTRWEVTTPATCTATGLKSKVCTSCGDVRATEVIPKTDHTDDGSGTCAVCGADMGTGGSSPAGSGYTLRADSFTMTDNVATESLTDAEIAGVASGFYTLTGSSAVKKRLFNTLDAGTNKTTEFLDMSKDGTNGIAFTLKSTEVPATIFISYGGPNSATAGSVTVKQGNTQVGTSSYKGSSGKDKTTYTLTLTTAGSYTIVSGTDGARVYSVVVEPAAEEHQWVETITRQPTCVSDGLKTLTCSKCQTTTTASIPATGEHTWGANVTRPNGDVVQICSVCNEEEVLSYGGGDDEEPDVPDGVVIFKAGDFTLADGVTSGEYTEADLTAHAPRCTVAGNTTKGAKNSSGGRVYFARINTNDTGANGIAFTVADNSIATVTVEASSGAADATSSVGLLDVATGTLVNVTRISSTASTNKTDHVLVYGNENSTTYITYSGLEGGKTYRVCSPSDAGATQNTARVYTIRLQESAVGSGTNLILDVATDLTTDVAKNEKADGDTETKNGFTLYYSTNTVIEGNTKNSFADDDSGYNGTRRLSLGGKPAKVGTTSLKNVIQFTTQGAATVKVWWVQGGGYDSSKPTEQKAVRNLYIFNSADNISDKTKAVTQTNYEGTGISTDTIVKNMALYSEMNLPGAGTYYLANSDDNNYFYKIEVVEASGVAVSGVTLNKSALSLAPGGTATLTATVKPAEATNRAVSWTSSDANVATVADGVVTAVGTGTATITVTTADGAKTAQCSVTVAAPTVCCSATDPHKKGTATVTINNGDTHYFDKDCTDTNMSVKYNGGTADSVWAAANTGVIDVRSNKGISNNVRGKGVAGSTAVTITTGSEVVTFTATMVDTASSAVAVESVTLSQATLNLTEGGTASLTATVSPANATDKTVTWTSDNDNVVTVTSTGDVTATGVGSATITAAAGDKTATCQVTVSAPTGTQTGIIAFSDATAFAAAAGNAGGTKTFDYGFYTLTMSAATKIDATGVKTFEQGTANEYITPTVDTGTANQTLRLAMNAADFNNKQDTIKFHANAGDTIKVWWVANQADRGIMVVNNANTSSVLYTSPKSTVKNQVCFDSCTVETAGDYLLGCYNDAANGTGGNYIFKIQVGVDATPTVSVTSVTLNKTSATLTVGQSEQLTATVLPENATNKTVTWTSDAAGVATVDTTGKVTAVAEGEAIITAAVGSKTATCTVTVTAAPGGGESCCSESNPHTANETWAFDIEAENGTTHYVTKDSGKKIFFYNSTVDGAADKNDYLLSNGKSSTSILGSRNTGTPTGMTRTCALFKMTTTAGTETVYYKKDDTSAERSVTIIVTDGSGSTDVPVESVAVAPTTLTLTVGGTGTLTATVSPDNATDKTVNWTTGNANVATVANGVVTAVGAGSTTITATAGGKSGTCTVTVEAAATPVSGVYIYESNKMLAKPQKGTHADNNGQDWSSSGQALSYNDYFTVMVCNNTRVDSSSKTWSDGYASEQRFNPSGKADKTKDSIKFTTANSGAVVKVWWVQTKGDEQNSDGTWKTTDLVQVCALDSNGTKTVSSNLTQPDGVALGADGRILKNSPQYSELTLGNAGTYYVGGDTSSVYIFRIEVWDGNAQPTLPTGVTLNKPSTTLTVGGTETLTATVAPNDATDKTVLWTSSNESVAKVNTTGKITAVAPGAATITAKTFWGNNITATCAVTVNAATVAVTGVSLNKTATTLSVGQTEPLTATVTPADATNQNVTWSSSVPAVATVENGVVTAVTRGTATITVTTADGNKTAQCTVTVNTVPAAKPNVSFSFDGTNANKLVGTTATMKYSVNGGTEWFDCTAGSTDLSGKTIAADKDIKVKDMGNNSTTGESEVRTIDITKGATPNGVGKDCETLLNTRGSISNLEAGMKYQKDGESEWKTVTSNAINNLTPGTYYIYRPATGTVLASDPQTVVIKRFDGTPAKTPAVVFTATGYDTGTLTGVTENLEYWIDGGEHQTTGESSTLHLENLPTDKDTFVISVQDPGDGLKTTPSAVQPITVTRAAKPTGLTGVAPRTLKQLDGSITGVTADMQYQADGAAGWTACTGTTITDLKPGAYSVRVAPKLAVLASEPAAVTVPAYAGTPEPEPNAGFEATGTDMGVLSGVDSSMKYRVNGGEWGDITGDNMEIPNLQPGKIEIYKPGDKTYTTDSSIKEITVTQGAKPTGQAGVAPTDLKQLDGSITGVTDDMRYKAGENGVWTDITGTTITGLAPGTYYVRTKASGTRLASEDSEAIVVPAYAGIQADDPNVSFSFSGSNPNKLMDTTARMEYSLNGGTNWTPCAEGSTDLTARLSQITAANDIKIRDQGDGVHYTPAANIQTIDITKPAAPDLDGVTADKPTNKSQNDGAISGVTTAMQYRVGTGGVWRDISGTQLTALEPGDYYLRYKAAGTALASDPSAAITVEAFVAKKEKAPEAVFTATGADRGTLSLADGESYTRVQFKRATTNWTNLTASVTIPNAVPGTIRLIRLGDGSTTDDSEESTVTIAQAPTPALTVGNGITQPSVIGGKGTITLPAGHQISTDNGTTWTDAATGANELNAGTYLIRVKFHDNVLASAPQTITLVEYTGSPADMPNVSFSFDGEKAGYLVGTTAQMEYSVTGEDGTWLPCTATETDLTGANITATDDIRIRDKGDGVHTTPSAIQTIVISKPAGPSGLGSTACTSNANDDGTITGVTAAMEYQKPGESSWTTCPEGTITGLGNGTYYVRYKATGHNLASANVTVSVSGYNTPDLTGTVAITGTPKYGQTLKAEITGSNATQPFHYEWSYHPAGGGAAISIGTDSDEYYLDPADFKGGVVPGGTITVTVVTDDTNSSISYIGTAITVAKADTQPAPTTPDGVKPTTKGGSDGKITGVTAAMQYQKPGTSTWIDCDGTTINDLTAGDYQVRYKASDTAGDGTPATVTVPAGTREKAPTPNAAFTATGDSTGTLSNVNTKLKYRLKVDDWTSDWENVTGDTMDLEHLQAGDLQLYQPGDDSNDAIALDSEVQSISITQAQTPNLDDSAISQPAQLGGKGTITLPAGYQISTDGTTWTDADTGANERAAGTYYIRVKAAGTALASESQTIVLRTYALMKAEAPSSVTFEARDDSFGYLRGADANMTYRIEEGEAQAITANDLLVEVPGACTVYVVRKGDNSVTKDSDPVPVTVLKAAAAPGGVAGVKPTTLAQTDGKLTGVKPTMEYQKAGANTWTSGADLTNETATGLTDGTYYVRYKAAGNTLASDSATVTVEKFTAGKADTPNAVFTAAGPNSGTLSLEAGESYTGVEYRRATNSDWMPMNAPVTIPNAVAGTIRVRRLGDGSTTTVSDEANVTIIKAPTPALTEDDVDQPSVIDGKGTVTLPAGCQISTDGTNWTDAAAGANELEPGTYQIRVKFHDNVLASAPQTIILTAFAGTQANTPNVSFSFDGDKAGILVGTSATMEYSVTGANGTWLPCTAGETVLSAETLKAITAESDIRIRDKGDATHTPSAIQTIIINKAPKLNLADFEVVPTTSAGSKDGKILRLANTDTVIEYRKGAAEAGDTDPDSHTGQYETVAAGVTEITGLGVGTYCVRTKATGTTLASDALHLDVDSDNALTIEIDTIDGSEITLLCSDANALDAVDTTAGCLLARYTTDNGVKTMEKAVIGTLTDSKITVPAGADLSQTGWVIFLLDGRCKPIYAKLDVDAFRAKS